LKKTVYHYSDRDLKDEEVITAYRDSFDGLTDAEKIFETAIRAFITNGHKIRAESLYTWETDRLVRNVWSRMKHKYFYELEIDRDDIVFQADLNYYNDGAAAAAAGNALDGIVALYESGESKPDATPRTEILVKKAIVKRMLLKR